MERGAQSICSKIFGHERLIFPSWHNNYPGVDNQCQLKFKTVKDRIDRNIRNSFDAIRNHIKENINEFK